MKRLTVERLARHWSQSELARKAGLNAATIGAVERGRLVPYPGQLSKIARALKWEDTPEALLEEVGQR